MVQFYEAIDNKHKFVAVFDDGEQVAFGAMGYEDYTQHKDKERKKLYLARHRNREDWNNPKTPGALSRWILWNKPTLKASIHDYIKKFHMHLE
jgi:hypothetical protein